MVKRTLGTETGPVLCEIVIEHRSYFRNQNRFSYFGAEKKSESVLDLKGPADIEELARSCGEGFWGSVSASSLPRIAPPGLPIAAGTAVESDRRVRLLSESVFVGGAEPLKSVALGYWQKMIT